MALDRSPRYSAATMPTDTHTADRPTDPNVLQRRASDPESSVWVGASAGTGKTKVLTDRVLRLMLAGTEPSRILCLTFTKAAAAEMANRIADRLSVWAVQDDDRLRANLEALTGQAPSRADVTAARRLFARVLDAPGGMKIQTIHAFCQSLLRRFPLEAGLAPNFEVMDDRTADELLEEAKQSVLLAGRYDPDSPLSEAVALLAGTVSEDDFNQLLADLTAERGRLRRILDANGGLEGAIAALRAHLRLAEGDSEAALLARACAEGGFDMIGLRRCCALMAGGLKSDVERSINLQRWLDSDEAGRSRGWRDYLSVFLTQKQDPLAKLLTKKLAESDPMALDILQREAARLIAVLEEQKRLLVGTYTAALLRLGEAMLGTYQRLKDARALLDFDDLILAASNLLTGQGVLAGRPDACAWVLYKLDGGLDHVLIDEAQDTNPEQWAVVKSIAEEFFSGLNAADGKIRTLFVVGDDKQSIFSFQRADPAEFARMRQHFGTKVAAAAQRWQVVDLQTSFRSVAAVLRAVDQVFAAGLARDGVAGDGVDVRHIPFRRGMAGKVEIWPLVRPADAAEPTPWAPPTSTEQADKPVARLAAVMADQIAYWLRQGEMLEPKGRPVRPGDIMVLVRRRNQFVQHLVRALKDRDVPVAGIDRMVLTEQLSVMDLLALGRFLILPEDDLTLATLLKSPLIGLTEDQLFQVAYGRPGSLWMALTNKAKSDAALAPAHDYLRALLADTDYRAPYELFAGLLTKPCPADPKPGEGSGRRAILARLGSEAMDPLDEFLNACLTFERDHVASLQGFIHWLEASQAEVKRELDPGGGEGEGLVRIMTVHGSKGLQAPIVFLPDTMGEPDKSPRILWPEPEAKGPDVPLYAPRRGMEHDGAKEVRAAADRRRDQEYRRLLYVALTRAEDRLIVCGWEQAAKSGGPGSWYRLVEQALGGMAKGVPFDFTAISPAGWAGEGLALHDVQTEPVKAPPPLAPSSGPADNLPAWARVPAPKDPTPSKPLMPSQPEGPEPAVRSPLGADDGKRYKRGTLMHKLLQVLPDTDPAHWRDSAAAWLARPAHELTAAEQREIALEAIAVLTDPRFAPLFGPDSRGEVPVVGLVGDWAISGQIDRLLVTETEVWIVDYKTNRPPPKQAEDVPVVYLQQMSAYRDAMRQLYPGRTVRSLLLWTDGPYTMELPDGLLDTHRPG